MKLRIEKMVFGGAGLARAEGKVIFIPYTLPGELVEADPSLEKKSFAEAALTALVEPSPDRAAPPCPYFGTCGGCHYQHAAYSGQVRIKVAILGEALERAGLRELPPIAPVFAEPLGYRNRIRLHIDRQSSALCYKERGSHRNLAIAQCPIAAPLLQTALRELDRIARSSGLGRDFQEAELFTNQDGSELLLSLWTGTASADLRARLESIASALRNRAAALTGAAVFLARPAQARHSRPAPENQSDAEGRALARWGRPALTYSAAGEPFRVSVGAFFQGNRFLVDELATLATSAEAGRVAWDLYAGVGLFSRVLVRSFERVVAVEGAGPSSADLKANLQGPGHRPVQSSILDFLRRSLRERPDFVMVDPPRAGLGPEITGLLSRIGPARITYVSCDPATLARDLAALVSSGYRIRDLHMVDLFPHTYHLETVARLELV